MTMSALYTTKPITLQALLKFYMRKLFQHNKNIKVKCVLPSPIAAAISLNCDTALLVAFQIGSLGEAFSIIGSRKSMMASTLEINDNMMS